MAVTGSSNVDDLISVHFSIVLSLSLTWAIFERVFFLLYNNSKALSWCMSRCHSIEKSSGKRRF